MRAIFKTEYDQDIRLFKHSGYAWSYGALLVLVFLAPLLVGSYLQSQLVFVFIYAIVGVGLLILTWPSLYSTFSFLPSLCVRSSMPPFSARTTR